MKNLSCQGWFRVFWRLTLYIAVIVAGAILLPQKLTFIWAGIAVIGLFLLVHWHNKSFGYRCDNCGHEFQISLLINFISPHGAGSGKRGLRGWKLLRCPECKKFSRATVIEKDPIMP